MRFLLASAGSRGDFQPLLALALGLERAGHSSVIATGPNYREEVDSFGLPFHPVGTDIEALMAERRDQLRLTPMRGIWEMASIVRAEMSAQLECLVPLARQADGVVGAGIQMAAGTAAQAAGVPYRYVCYTPQMLRSSYHPHSLFPWQGLPRPVNRILWVAHSTLSNRLLRGILNARRVTLGLPRVRDIQDHMVPPDGSLLAVDPEITPLPPDLPPGARATGSFHLQDTRPLPPDLLRFLDRGPPPVYLGFGSMPDPDSAATTRLLLDATRRTGHRALISAGWAGFGGENLGDGVHVVGPVSHGALFPRVAAVVHHGGAGTTAAAARAGVPQVVVPHVFDQFGFARRMQEAGVAAGAIPRTRLTAERLATALARISSDEELRARATRMGETLRARSGVEAAVKILTHLSPAAAAAS